MHLLLGLMLTLRTVFTVAAVCNFWDYCLHLLGLILIMSRAHAYIVYSHSTEQGV
jgi:hypothetical protein